MTTPSFDLNNLSIPARSADDMLALTRQLITAFNAKPLEFVKPRITAVHDRSTQLQSSLVLALKGPESDSQPGERREVDRTADRLWAAIRNRAASWAALPKGDLDEETSQVVDAAETILSLLFGQGTSWTNARYALQWANAETRLNALSTYHSEDTIHAVLGTPFYKALQDVHARYGEVMGITAVAADGQSSASGVSESLLAMRAALQDYVRGVLGTATTLDPATITHAEALLRPILERREALKVSNKPKAAPQTADAPAEEAITVPIPAVA